MKVLVFGNSGSGKSTYARALARREGLAHFELDLIFWEEIAIERSIDAVVADLQNFIDSHPAWVIEGCYGDLVQIASTYCTRMVFLNPGFEMCLENNASRPWEPHKYASREEQDAMFATLQEWVARYYDRSDAMSYRAHREIFDAFAGPKIEHRDMAAYGP